MARAQHPFARKGGDLNRLRERLLDAMWDDVGVIRDKAGLERGLGKLDAIEAELLAAGVPDGDRAFNLTWHDWLNLRSLVEISKVIALAALKRENSRGAHYREDFPGEGDLATSTFTVARQRDGRLDIADEPVAVHHRPPGREPAEGGGGVNRTGSEYAGWWIAGAMASEHIALDRSRYSAVIAALVPGIQPSTCSL